MKTIQLFLCLLALAAISCTDSESTTTAAKNSVSLNKHNTNVVKDISHSNSVLVGTWSWTGTYGGLVFTAETPASTGYTKKIVFTNNLTYRMYTNDVITSHGTYSISSHHCIHSGGPKPLLHFSDVTQQDQMIESISAANLSLSDDSYDGYGSTYTKI
jgi:hypothetical protein